MNNNNRRRSFRGRQQKNNFRRRPSSNHGTNGHFSTNIGNKNFNRNGSTSNPISIEKLITKFQQLAKDAQSNGDPVLSQNYLQHADHYLRRYNELNSKRENLVDKTITEEKSLSEKKEPTDKEGHQITN